MKAQAGALAIVVTVGLALVAPVAVAANSRVGSQLVIASSASYDEATGESHSLYVEALAVAGEPAQIIFGRYDELPITCADGWDGIAITWVDGMGSGSIVMGRDLRSARVSGELDLQTMTTTLCGDEEPLVTETTGVALEGTINGVGPRLMETQAQAQRLLPGANIHWKGRLTGRQGAGTFRLGGDRFEISDALFGRITEVAHLSGHGIPLPRLAMTAMTAAAAGSTQLAGSAVFAEGFWEQGSEDAYEGMFVGAIRLKGGGTVVEVHAYAEHLVSCPDGWDGYAGVYRDGWATGTLDVPQRYVSADIAATMDLMTTTIDGCTGEATSTTEASIPVSATLTASGRPVQGTSRYTVRLGAGLMLRARTWETARSAVGSMTVGDEAHEASFGAIGRERWQLR